MVHFDIEELKAKNISRETSIWLEGLEEWTNAGEIEELKSLILLTPSPFKTNVSEVPPIPKIETTRTEVVYQPEKKKSKVGNTI